ncbi:MAG: peptidoglycan DD-metalloendopeptidase family protein, partial [bacterium]|nr:peptidoglycan DD-metalloendopeptidase family protein [bacterium]
GSAAIPKNMTRPLLGIRLLVVLLFLAINFFAASNFVNSHEDLPLGQSTSDQAKRLEDIRKQITETETLLSSARQKKATLQNEIAYQDSQIKLTELKIAETQEEIDSLTTQIDRLEGVLSGLSEVFAERAVETYKVKRLEDPFVLLVTSDSVSQFISRFHYLRKIQEHDRELLLQMQVSQTNYEDQRVKVESLQTRLETQKSTLSKQKTQKQNLLTVTKNDEKRYQELLVALKADEIAIQRAISSLISQIVAGIATGSPVSKGQIVGQQGRTGNVYPRDPNAYSTCSPYCGSHLHFMVFTCNLVTNPNALSSNGGCHTNPDPYLNDGQYRRPLDYQYISQGYGNTSFAQSGTGGYAFHSGMDLVAFHGAPIYAIDNGTVYYGTDSGGGKYALVKHRDDFWSAYWHLQ